jgi:hypothetical protein
VAASRRLPELLETGQTRTMLSRPKDMEACPRVRTFEDALREGVAEVSWPGTLKLEAIAAPMYMQTDQAPISRYTSQDTVARGLVQDAFCIYNLTRVSHALLFFTLVVHTHC